MSPSPTSDVTSAGTLYVVATPIGNLQDLTPRAREILAAVDLVAAEDTRHSGRLMQRLGIRTPLVSLHEHNEQARTPEVIERLQAGESVALITDAGTPLVSDPGYRLLRAAREARLRVSPLPGACAAIAALSVAGLATDRFAFEGFLPAKGGARRRRLQQLAHEPRVMVFYESPKRLRDCLADMAASFGGGREATLARELTKLHETVLSGTLASLRARAEEDDALRMGEIVLVVAGAAVVSEQVRREAEAARVLDLLLGDGLSPRQAASLAARITGGARNPLYRRALARADGREPAPQQQTDE